MGSFVLKNCGIYLDGYDVSGDHNQISLTGTREILDSTVFTATGQNKTKLPGLKDYKFSGNGYVTFDDDNDGSDEVFNSKIAAVQKPLTIVPYARSAGNLAYFMQAHLAEYQLGARIGEIVAFTINAEGHDELVNGTVLVNSTLTATGTGTAFQLGAVAANEYIYAAFHVFGVSTGDTIDMIIQSDDTEGFISPTNIITFNQMTAKGSQWAARVAGPITDTWWRVSYTLGGTDISIPCLVVMGIQKSL